MCANVSFICAFAAHVTLRIAVPALIGALNSRGIVSQLLCQWHEGLRTPCKQANNRTQVSALALSRQ